MLRIHRLNTEELQKGQHSGGYQLTPVILVSREAEIRRMTAQG
jgi:hypothetical protein